MLAPQVTGEDIDPVTLRCHRAAMASKGGGPVSALPCAISLSETVLAPIVTVYFRRQRL